MLKLFTQHTVRQINTILERHVTITQVLLRLKQSSIRLINVKTAIQGWDRKLRKAGVGDIDFNLKCLVAHVLKRKINTLHEYNHIQFNDEQLKEFERLCEARCARMPLQHIVGEWDFLGITLKTDPDVFIPRPDTEEFVAKVIDVYRNFQQPVEMLEVGCGSGAMSLAILHTLPNIRSVGVDCCKEAVVLASKNAKLLSLQDRFKVYNHTTAEKDYLPKDLKASKFDLIISNPPYVKTEEFALLHPEVMLYENLNALDGGPDGLRIARLVLDCACEHLKSGGKLWLELGAEHPPLIKTIINLQYEGRLRYICSFLDQYKRDRFVEVEKV